VRAQGGRGKHIQICLCLAQSIFFELPRPANEATEFQTTTKRRGALVSIPTQSERTLRVQATTRSARAKWVRAKVSTSPHEVFCVINSLDRSPTASTSFAQKRKEVVVMRPPAGPIYWSVMSAILLFPWSVVGTWFFLRRRRRKDKKLREKDYGATS